MDRLKLAKKCKELSKIFKELDKKVIDAKVDMMSVSAPHIDENNFCGTPACHAGWFWFSQKKEINDKNFDYINGARRMAKFLGFKSVSKLESFFEKNPELWGTKDADGMFCNEAAFKDVRKLDKDGFFTGPLTLKEISKKWKQVGKRLEESVSQGKA